MLLILLRLAHEARPEPFVIVKEAMARDKLVANWSGKIYERARNVVLDRGFIERVREGGGRGNPHGYSLKKPSPIGAQYNQTLLSRFSLCGSQISLCGSQKKNARVVVSLAPVSSVTAEPAPMLFDAGALPLLPTRDEQLRIAACAFLADRPRGPHTQLAAAVGISSQHFTNWKARHTRLKPDVAGMLRDLIDADRVALSERAQAVDRMPRRICAEIAADVQFDRVNDDLPTHAGAVGRHAAHACVEGG